MHKLRILIGLACVFAATGLSTRAAEPVTASSAVERMSEPGSEARQLARRAGVWRVVATLWPAPDADPVVTPI